MNVALPDGRPDIIVPDYLCDWLYVTYGLRTDQITEWVLNMTPRTFQRGVDQAKCWQIVRRHFGDSASFLINNSDNGFLTQEVIGRLTVESAEEIDFDEFKSDIACALPSITEIEIE